MCPNRQKKAKGGGGNSHNRAVAKAAPPPAAAGTTGESSRSPLGGESPEAQHEEGLQPFLSLGDSIGLLALIVSLILWAVSPSSLARCIGVLLAGSQSALLAYKAHWSRKWHVVVRRAAALIVFVLVVLVAGYQPFSQWRQERAIRSILSFSAVSVGIGNMPGRERVATFDGKPWDEEHYGDLRVLVGNTRDVALLNLDLSIDLSDSDKDIRIVGIGQLSTINGVEFRQSQAPVGSLPVIRLRGKDGKTYNLPVDSMTQGMNMPAKRLRVICPRLEPTEGLKLILATVDGSPSKVVPKQIRITGTVFADSASGFLRSNFDALVPVLQ